MLGLAVAAVTGTVCLPAADYSDLLFRVSTLKESGTGNPIYFNGPGGVALDRLGNLYVSETDREMGLGNTIWKITPGGEATLFAGARGGWGFQDGPADSARFAIPEGITVDESGAVYVADSRNNAVRKISTDRIVTTVGSNFSNCMDVAVDAAGNVFVADTSSHVIRKITPQGDIQVFAGSEGAGGSADGTGSAARFLYPAGVALDDDGNLFVADWYNYTVRKITPQGVVTTVAGSAGVTGFVDGERGVARFGRLAGIAVDSSGNIYVSEPSYHVVRRITPSGFVSTIAGFPGVAGSNDGDAERALLYHPVGVAVDSGGTVYVADMGNNRIRVITPPAAPAIDEHPTSQTIASGSSVAFAAAASGPEPMTYQWEKNGVAIAGATSPTLVIRNATAADAGAYDCIVTNLIGTTTSRAASLAITETSNPGRIVNLSVRATAGMDGMPLIAGFYIGGSGTTGSGNLLLRGVGPALTDFGVPNVLADPVLALYRGQTVIASNDNWATPASNGVAVQTASSKTGAFSLPDLPGLDSALLPELPEINTPYTLWVSGSAPGTALAEIYDLNSEYSPTSPRLLNVSARVDLGPGPDVAIAGFVIGGTSAKTVLVRAVGPSLVRFGIDTQLLRPHLELHAKVNGADTILATNAGWGGDAEVSAIGDLVGAFPMVSITTVDAAIVRTLSPGPYTIHVTGLQGTSGTVLIEVYEVP